MKKTFYLVALPLVLVLQGCFSKDIRINHFATEIIETGEIKAETTPGSFSESPVLFLNFSPKWGSIQTSGDSSNSESVRKFDSLASRMGDVHHQETYNVFEYAAYQVENKRIFLFVPVDNITIKSSIPWSDSRNAGDDISSEFVLLTQVSDRYVLTGQKYDATPSEKGKFGANALKEYYEKMNEEAAQTGYSATVFELLSEFDFSKYTFVSCVTKTLNRHFGALTSLNPKLLEPQTLTLEFTYRDGRTTSTEVVIP